MLSDRYIIRFLPDTTVLMSYRPGFDYRLVHAIDKAVLGYIITFLPDITVLMSYRPGFDYGPAHAIEKAVLGYISLQLLMFSQSISSSTITDAICS